VQLDLKELQVLKEQLDLKVQQVLKEQ